MHRCVDPKIMNDGGDGDSSHVCYSVATRRTEAADRPRNSHDQVGVQETATAAVPR